MVTEGAGECVAPLPEQLIRKIRETAVARTSQVACRVQVELQARDRRVVTSTWRRAPQLRVVGDTLLQ